MSFVIKTLSALVLLTTSHIGFAEARDYGQSAGPRQTYPVCTYQHSPGFFETLNPGIFYGTYSTAKKEHTIGGKCSFRTEVSYPPSTSPYNHV